MRKNNRKVFSLLLLTLFFSMTTVSAEILIDGFEEGFNWSISKPEDVNATAMLVDDAYVGAKAVKLSADAVTTDKYVYFVKNAGSDGIWRGTDAISLWIKGNEKINLTIVAEGWAKNFTYEVLANNQWTRVVIPWEKFKERGSGAPLNIETASVNDLRLAKYGKWDAFEVIIDDIRVVNLGNVQGKVTNDIGQPVSGATVSFGNLNTTTNEQGEYAFEKVIPGEYNLKIQRNSYLSFECSILVDQNGITKDVVLAVQEMLDDMEGLDLKWRKSASITTNVSLTTDAKLGNGALKVEVGANPLDNMGYSYAILPQVGSGGGWATVDGITFWLKGDGSGEEIAMCISTGSWQKYYKHKIKLNNTDWEYFAIPWSSFIPDSGPAIPLDPKTTIIDEFRITKNGIWQQPYWFCLDEVKVANFNGTINGTVINSVGKPVKGATISCSGINKITNEQGGFTLNVPAAIMDIYCSRSGYLTAKKTVEVTDNAIVEVVCSLESDPIIDNFDRDDLGSRWLKTTSAGVDVQLMTTSESYADTGALKININAAPTGENYAQIILNEAGNGGEWMSFDGISFWLKSSKEEGMITIQIRSNNWGKSWSKKLMVEGTEWQEFLIPWDAFKLDNNTVSLDIINEEINDIRWMVNGSWAVPYELLIDEIQAVTFDNMLIGKVVNIYGSPISEATVEAEGINFVTDSDGNYSLSNLPWGKITLRISKEGYSPEAQTLYLDKQVPVSTVNCVLRQVDVIIDDFESSSLYWNKVATVPVTYTRTDDAKVGTGAMQIIIPPSTNSANYAIVVRPKERIEGDLSNTDGIAFWVKGKKRTSGLFLRLAANSWTKNYNYQLPLIDTEWKRLVIPWDEFYDGSTQFSVSQMESLNDLRLGITGEWDDTNIIIDDIRAVKFTGSIGGVVVRNDTKMPIASASVRVGGLVVATNMDGLFLLESIPEGEWIVETTVFGMRTKQLTTNVIRDQKNDLFIEMSPSFGDIEGNVTDESGAPLKDAIVSSGTSFSYTDDQGWYRLNVPIGEVEVTAVKTGYLVKMQTVLVNEMAVAELNFQLSSSQDSTVPPPVEELRASGDVAGTIQLSWIPITDEEAYLYNIYRSESPTVDPLDLVPYAMLVKAEGAIWIDKKVEINKELFYKIVRVGINGDCSLSSEKVSAFTHKASGKVHGKVTDLAGEPIPGALVRFQDLWTYTDANGDYELVDFPIGVCFLEISKDGFKTEKVSTIIEGDGAERNIDVILELGKYPSSLAIVGAAATPEAIRPFGKHNKTFISFILSQPSILKAEVYSTGGTKILTLAESVYYQTGSHYLTWDGLDKNGKTLPNGIYVVYIRAQEYQGQRWDVAKIAVGVFGR